MAIMLITWVTKEDVRVCPVCKPHHGTTWRFDTEHDPFPTVLYSHIGGYPMWDATRDRSMSHLQLRNQGKGVPCRCVLNVTFDLSEIQEAIHDKLTWAIQMKVLPPASTVML